MKLALKRGLPLAIALLSVLVAAAPANATLTPVNGTISGTSSNFQVVQGSVTISCGRSTVTGTINGTGTAISWTNDFVSGTGRTCEESLFRSSCTVTGGRTTHRSDRKS